MKTRPWSALVCILLLGPSAFASLPDPVTYQSAKATIVFVHPDKFTDIRESSMSSEKGRKFMLDALAAYLIGEADTFVPDGDRLTMLFTDITVAGFFPPQSNASRGRRYLRFVGFPDYRFAWELTGRDGVVLKKGRLDYSDKEYWSISNDTAPLTIDKVELKVWMQGQFKSPNK
jgi:hypothetical protein